MERRAIFAGVVNGLSCALRGTGNPIRIGSRSGWRGTQVFPSGILRCVAEIVTLARIPMFQASESRCYLEWTRCRRGWASSPIYLLQDVSTGFSLFCVVQMTRRFSGFFGFYHDGLCMFFGFCCGWNILGLAGVRWCFCLPWNLIFAWHKFDIRLGKRIYPATHGESRREIPWIFDKQLQGNLKVRVGNRQRETGVSLNSAGIVLFIISPGFAAQTTSLLRKKTYNIAAMGTI